MVAILRSALSMSAATTLSRVTGYARTMTQAAVLGTGAVANAYTLSNTLPTQLYELFMGACSPQSSSRSSSNASPGTAKRTPGASQTLSSP